MGRGKALDHKAIFYMIIDTMYEKHVSAFKACKLLGIKDAQWRVSRDSDPSYYEIYDKARWHWINNMAQEIIDITEEDLPLDVNGRIDPGAVSRNRLRIDTRKWLLSKIAPKKYGDKIEHEHKGDVTINQITRTVIDPQRTIDITPEPPKLELDNENGEDHDDDSVGR